MLDHRRRGWEIPASETTPESIFLNRRAFFVGAGAALTVAGLLRRAHADDADPTTGLYPAKRNPAYTLDRDVTPEKVNLHYNNFYEFTTSKRVDADALKTRPWTVTIDGLVEKKETIDVDDLVKAIGLEERLYRHRCVEAWSMAIPWTGFPLKALVDRAKPLSAAKYVRFETFLADPSGDAVEVRIQVGEIDRQDQLRRRPAADLLASPRPGRIRLLGQRQPGRAASALEPGARNLPDDRRAAADAPLQRLRRAGRRALQGAGERAALHVSGQ